MKRKEANGTDMKKEWMARFRRPEAMDRSFLFWAWNGRLQEEELRRQVREMKQAGAGGFFIHSRDGLETEYMGTDWMNGVKAVVKEAKEQGLLVWLYDEDRWPSGSAGGSVTREKDFCCKGLTLEVGRAEAYGAICQRENGAGTAGADDEIGLLAMYASVIEEDRVKQFRRIRCDGTDVLRPGEVLLTVRLERSETSEWFNGQAPPDNLNPDCVRRFIEETHEKYKRAVGEEFGKTIRGIFTDEPSLNDRHAYFGETKSWIPWTFGFAAYFQRQNGYDFFEELPQFYFHGKRSEKIRHDYWYAVTKRYGETYFKSIQEWCDRNHLLFTGHFLQEDKMGLCARVNGAVMPNYQYQHVPGIDLLCEQTEEYMTVKQCSSVANQLDRPYVLSETYGCTGWEFTLEGQKWVGDWQYILGVNHRCQHLALYSLRGCRKRDYPPSFHYNNTAWGENSIVEDYFGRMSLVLEQGKAVRDILLLHPMTTVWSRLGVNPYGNPKRSGERDVPELNAYGDAFNRLIAFLERRHLDCDLGDELLIKQYGGVKDGKFRIGRAVYGAVVIPQVDTLMQSTCEYLKEYMRQGGYVYLLGEMPTMVEGDRTAWKRYGLDEGEEHLVRVPDWEELACQLERYRTIHIQKDTGEEQEDILYQLREDLDGRYLVMINNNRTKAAGALVKIPGTGTVYELSLLTGNLRKRESWMSGEHIQLPVLLEPTGSAAFFISNEKTSDTSPGIPDQWLRQKEKRVDQFDYRLDCRNVLPLDQCRYRMDGNRFSPVMEVWKAQREIRDTLGMRDIHFNGIEQRYRWAKKRHANDGRLVELEFTFACEVDKEPAWLVLERMEEFEVQLNGTPAGGTQEGWFLDREFPVQFLGNLRKGRNQLTICCRYKNDMELENCYLLGRFGVSGDRCVIPLPQTMEAGDWTKQGLMHYCGSVTYIADYTCEEPGRCVMLKLPAIKGVYIRVSVNGTVWKIPWNFSRMVDISRAIREGDNRVEIQVTGSPRNMLGPFHQKEKPRNTHDASFCPEGEAYSAAYLLEPYGMMGPLIFYETEEVWDDSIYQESL